MKNKFTKPLSTNRADVVCDKCGAAFALNHLGVKRYADGIEISYFACVQCGHKYVYLVTDSNLRKVIKNNKVARGKMQKSYAGVNDVYTKQQSEILMGKYADRIRSLN